MTGMNFDDAVASEALRLRSVTDRLLSELGTADAASETRAPATRSPVWIEDGRLLYRAVGEGGGPDVAELVAGRPVGNVASWLALHDKGLVAVCLRDPGGDEYELLVFRVAQGLGRLIHSDARVSPAVRSCGDCLVWVQRDHAHRPHRVLAWSEDDGLRELYIDDDPRFRVSLGSADGRQVVVFSRGAGCSEIALAEHQNSSVGFSVAIVVPREENSVCAAALTGGYLTILDRKAQHLRVGQRGRMDRTEFPSGFFGERVGVVDGLVYVEGRMDGRAAVWCPAWGVAALWVAPYGGVIQPARVDGRRLHLGVSSPIHPLEMCIGADDGSWDVAPTPRPDVDAGRLWAGGRDGTDIPITLFRSAPADGDRPRPVLAMVYGCYGIPLDSMFDPLIALLIESGIGVALCHVRGGGEWGSDWHSAAKGRWKSRSIDDYLACVEYLADRPDVDDRRIGCLASSAGALVATSAVLRRPDLFAAAELVHPFLTPELILADEDAPLAATDWEEFGNPVSGDGWVPSVSPLAFAEQMERTDLPKFWIRAGSSDFRTPLWSIEAWLDVMTSVQGQSWPAPVVQVGAHAHSGPSDGPEARAANCLAIGWLVDALG